MVFIFTRLPYKTDRQLRLRGGLSLKHHARVLRIASITGGYYLTSRSKPPFGVAAHLGRFSTGGLCFQLFIYYVYHQDDRLTIYNYSDQQTSFTYSVNFEHSIQIMNPAQADFDNVPSETIFIFLLTASPILSWKTCVL